MSSAETINSEPKLRVLQAGSTAYPGGVSNAIKTLCMSLRRLGHEVTLFTDGADLDELKAHGIACHVTELRQHPKVLLQGTWQLRKILKSFRPEVVHVHGRSTALRCLLAGRSADWFTLHNTHLTHQVAFYDTGLLKQHGRPPQCRNGRPALSRKRRHRLCRSHHRRPPGNLAAARQALSGLVAPTMLRAHLGCAEPCRAQRSPQCARGAGPVRWSAAQGLAPPRRARRPDLPRSGG